MKTKSYSFISKSKNANVFVKAKSKKNVIIYARKVLGDTLTNSQIFVSDRQDWGQSSVESTHPELF